ncbi:MAG: hypothetical protein Q4E41_02740 [Bacteroidales bacterium]|nr:hypothetical protein [Bacteroidales bacterium]
MDQKMGGFWSKSEIKMGVSGVSGVPGVPGVSSPKLKTENLCRTKISPTERHAHQPKMNIHPLNLCKS